MYNKIKTQNIKLKEVIYSVDLLSYDPKYISYTVTGIVINEENHYDIYVDFSKTPKYLNSNQFYYTYSKIKAERIVDNLKKVIKKQETKLKNKKLIHLENDKNLKVIDKKYLDREVMIKIGPDSWIKSRIADIKSSDKKNVYCFNTIPKGAGCYSTSREGKSWYFFSKEAEIKKQIEILQAQLKKLESEQ
jgi:hypothetical protein